MVGSTAYNRRTVAFFVETVAAPAVGSGLFCPARSSGPQPTGAGRFSSPVASFATFPGESELFRTATSALTCPAGFFCVDGAQMRCPGGHLCRRGAVDPEPCQDQRFFCQNGVKEAVSVGNYAVSSCIGNKKRDRDIVCPTASLAPE